MSFGGFVGRLFVSAETHLGEGCNPSYSNYMPHAEEVNENSVEATEVVRSMDIPETSYVIGVDFKRLPR